MLTYVVSHVQQDRSYTYTIVKKDDGLFPGEFVNYSARVSFKPITDKDMTFAEWCRTSLMMHC